MPACAWESERWARQSLKKKAVNISTRDGGNYGSDTDVLNCTRRTHTGKETRNEVSDWHRRVETRSWQWTGCCLGTDLLKTRGRQECPLQGLCGIRILPNTSHVKTDSQRNKSSQPRVLSKQTRSLSRDPLSLAKSAHSGVQSLLKIPPVPCHNEHFTNWRSIIKQESITGALRPWPL